MEGSGGLLSGPFSRVEFRVRVESGGSCGLRSMYCEYTDGRTKSDSRNGSGKAYEDSQRILRCSEAFLIV
jgi:hypothetical protein